MAIHSALFTPRDNLLSTHSYLSLERTSHILIDTAITLTQNKVKGYKNILCYQLRWRNHLTFYKVNNNFYFSLVDQSSLVNFRQCQNINCQEDYEEKIELRQNKAVG